MEKLYMGTITEVYFEISVKGNETSTIKAIESDILKHFDVLKQVDNFKEVTSSFGSVDFEEYFNFHIELKFNGNLEYSEDDFLHLLKRLTGGFHPIKDIRIKKRSEDIVSITDKLKSADDDDDDEFT